jgi:hypothetical protein
MITYHFHAEQRQIKKVLCQTDHTAGNHWHTPLQKLTISFCVKILFGMRKIK